MVDRSKEKNGLTLYEHLLDFVIMFHASGVRNCLMSVRSEANVPPGGWSSSSTLSSLENLLPVVVYCFILASSIPNQ